MAREEVNVLDLFAMLLLIVGGINWGLVGVFNFSLISFIFGAGSLLSKVVYGLIGFAGLYGLYLFGKMILMMVRR